MFYFRTELYCTDCDEWYDASDKLKVLFIDVQSNVHGEDVITFDCFVCNSRQECLPKIIEGYD